MSETTHIMKTLPLTYDESINDISELLFIQLEDTLSIDSQNDKLAAEKTDLLIRSIIENTEKFI